MTESRKYEYVPAGGAFNDATARVYKNTYLQNPAHMSAYILNRLASSTVQKGVTNPSASVTLVTNAYDNLGTGCNATILAATETPGQHDSATYTTGYLTRGNIRSVITPGDSGCIQYDVTGTVRSTTSNLTTQSYTLQTGRNNTVPSQITTCSFTSTMNTDALLRPVSQTGPNGDTGSVGYDLADRPSTTTSPTGEVTTYQYFYTASPDPYVQATTGTKWVKTYLDGFGRTVRTEAGFTNTSGSTIDSVTKMEYGACACSPLGKVKKVSRPYRGTATPVWTEYEYDASGRVKKVIQPPNTGTAGSSGNTQHSWMGSMLTVTDPKGNYKKYTWDAFGNLVFVVEQRPGGEWGTAYTYDLLNHLTDVNSTRGSYSQARAFHYNAEQRLSMVIMPESGITTYDYYPSGLLHRKTFISGSKVEYGYDSLKRLITVNRFMAGSSTPDVCQSLTMNYDVPWTIGQAGPSSPLNRQVTRTWGSSNTAVCPGGQMVEKLSYNPAGQILGKQLSITRGSVTRDLTAWWGYDAQGRLTDEIYPNSWSLVGPYKPEFKFGHDYDAMYRLRFKQWYAYDSAYNLQTLKVGEDAQYGADQQMTQLKVLSVTEARTYNNLGQLTGIGTNPVNTNSVALFYDYSPTANDGRAVSMTDMSLVNNVPANEIVSYGYDEMKRLTSATTTGPQWGLSFGYDAYSNLQSQTVTKGSGPTQFSLSVNSTTNRVIGYTYDLNGNVTNDTVRTYGWDAENRLLSVNGVTKYSYDPENLRVYDGTAYYFYAPDGRMLGKYSPGTGTQWNTDQVNVHYNGRLIATGVINSSGTGVEFTAVVTDRVGSVRMHGSQTMNYYPYGQERVVTGNDKNKFGTYWRDSLTGLDYAQQRYYQSGIGRFLSPDLSGLNESVHDPASWNQYAYVQGDPVNWIDPTGEKRCEDSEYIYPDGFTTTLGAALNTNTEVGIFSAVVWAEASKDPRNIADKLAVAYSIVNRFLIVNNFIQVWIPSSRTTNGIEWINPTNLGWGAPNGTLRSILGARGQFVTVEGGERNPQLASRQRAELDSVLSSDSTSNACWNLARAASIAITAIQEPWNNPFPNGLVTAFSHSQGKSSRIGEVFLGSAGSPNRYFGLPNNYQINPTALPLPPNSWSRSIDSGPRRSSGGGR